MVFTPPNCRGLPAYTRSGIEPNQITRVLGGFGANHPTQEPFLAVFGHFLGPPLLGLFGGFSGVFGGFRDSGLPGVRAGPDRGAPGLTDFLVNWEQPDMTQFRQSPLPIFADLIDRSVVLPCPKGPFRPCVCPSCFAITFDQDLLSKIVNKECCSFFRIYWVATPLLSATGSWTCPP